MNAPIVTEKVIEQIKADKYDMIMLNFANADMVGHTGVFEAAVKAVETVDTCVGKIVEALRAVDGQLLIMLTTAMQKRWLIPKRAAPIRLIRPITYRASWSVKNTRMNISTTAS